MSNHADRRGFIQAVGSALLAGPAVVVAAQPADPPFRSRLDDESDGELYERRRCYHLRVESAGNAHLRLVVDLLDTVKHLAVLYLDAHNAGCKCDHCAHARPWSLGAIRQDLTALTWNCNQVRGGISGVLAYDGAEDVDRVEQMLNQDEATDGEILRALADVSDDVDGRYELEFADAPTAVGVTS